MQSLRELMRNWLGVSVLELKQQAQQRALIEAMASETLKREEATRRARSSTPADDSFDEETARGDVPNFHGHLGRH